MEENDADETLRALKRVAASGGKLQGSFYLACDSSAAQAGLVVTLVPRDPKGQKAARQGRALRKALGATRFGRGIVRLDSGKLRFSLASGNASAAIVKKAFRGAFSGKLAKVLRAARISTPDSDDDISDEVADTARENDPVLDALLQEQGRLAAQNVVLAQSFLSVAEEAEERAALAAQLLDEIAALEAAGLGETARLQDLRAELAASVAVGPELDLTPGTPLPPDMVSLMTDAADTLADISRAFPAEALQRARDDVLHTWAAAQPPLQSLQAALRSSGDPDLVAIADGGIDAVLRAPARALGAGLSAEGAEALARHLLEHPAIAAIDDNPYAVAVGLRDTLAPALLRLAQAARAVEAR